MDEDDGVEGMVEVLWIQDAVTMSMSYDVRSWRVEQAHGDCLRLNEQSLESRVYISHEATLKDTDVSWPVALTASTRENQRLMLFSQAVPPSA